jgi:RimJ/RimL family protein N-acetyltransferase
MQVETSRLLLRSWRDSDRGPFHALNSDPVVMEFLPKLLTREESDAMIDRHQERILAGDYGFWAMEERESGAFLGFAGLFRPLFEAPFTLCAEVGWRLARAHWGKGFATEAGRAALALGFARGLEEVLSFTVPANRRSEAVMQRLGMRRNSAEDFEHPRLPIGHPLRRHMLYRISRASFVPPNRALGT